MAVSVVLALDLIGTLAFAISGATLGVRKQLDLFGVLVLSFAAATAGGIARDLLVAEIPNVLRREFYAVAALLGAACVVVGDALGVPATPTAVVGALLCFVLRYLAIRRNWQLPLARADQGG